MGNRQPKVKSDFGWFSTCEQVRKVLDEDSGSIAGDLLQSSIVVTGANTGIGKTTAQHLSYLGGTVILACRNLSKAKQAIADIRAAPVPKEYWIEGKDLKLVAMRLDLSDLNSVKSFAQTLESQVKSEQIPSVRAMVLNAGMMPLKAETSSQGYELAFAVNHLGHYFLMRQLLTSKDASETFHKNLCRVVMLSSHTIFGSLATKNITDERSLIHYVAGVPQQGLPPHKVSTITNYGSTKLCNLLFSQSLAEGRSFGSGVKISACALNPGVVQTDVMRDSAFMNFLMKWIGWVFKTPNQGASTSFFCSLVADEEVNGKYFSDCKEVKVPSLSTGDKGKEAREVLWSLSERLCEEFLAAG